MADRLATSGANIHAVLVFHGGKLVFERYFKGNDEVPLSFLGSRVANVAFDADTLHSLKSVSKSVASLAVGIAIGRGLIRGVDEPILGFFPELADMRTPQRDRLLLRHALGMTMGLEWIEATPATGDLANDEARMYRARRGSARSGSMPSASASASTRSASQAGPADPASSSEADVTGTAFIT